MAPPVSTPTPEPAIKKGRRRRLISPKDEDEPSSTNSKMALIATPPADLAATFREDLTNMRNLVTCSICNQLLYEPWTLACGHTYCYSCLCSWFVPNKRKKTCPECRSRVAQIPAPNFLVKQMVDIFIMRVELMPADESVEQHNIKRAEEIAEVEKDKNAVEGLFKGTFPKQDAQLKFDEEDGVLRCPYCSHEHEGGPNCSNCGADIDDFSDMDDLDFDADLEHDFGEMEEEMERELGAEGELFFGGNNAIGGAGDHRLMHGPHRMRYRIRDPRIESSETSRSEDSEVEDDEDDDAGSLRDFVADDDESPRQERVPRDRQVITITSDSDSDEEEDIVTRQPRRRPRRRIIEGSSSPSALTVTDEGMNDSEVGDMHSEADRLRTAGWSPLDHGTDSDPDEPDGYQGRYGYGYGSTLDGNDSDEDSDTNTETMAGNMPDDEDHLRDDVSETSTDRENNPYNSDFRRYRPAVYEHLGEDEDEDDEEMQHAAMDHDGDTEMSVSPDARRSISTNPYRSNSELRSSREPSVSTNYNDDFDERSISRPTVGINGNRSNNQQRAENIGTANQIHEEQDDSSDASIRPPVRRRRPRAPFSTSQVNERIFQNHLQSYGIGSREHPVELEELNERPEGNPHYPFLTASQHAALEPGVLNRRINTYRSRSERQDDGSRRSRTPSAVPVNNQSPSRRARARPVRNLLIMGDSDDE